ncbi:response regulator transcription factor [Pseudarthrobacter sp. NPDC092424]|uniref:response regulator transcription factor n=1 Tax=Pseudarthrobacter sp. NPDC092424 TaxID=3364415 RepID=UPI003814B688
MGGIRVVVIEDDLDMRNLLEAVLHQSGYEVFTAVDGRSGLELTRTAQPDVVTVDAGLPDLDGLEVLRQIRGFSCARVVMLTGRTHPADQEAAFEAGAADYIIKPFRPRDVRARIAALLQPSNPNAGGQRASE